MSLLECSDTLKYILSFCSPLELYNLRRVNNYLYILIKECCYKWDNGIRLINGKHWGLYHGIYDTWITDTFAIHFYIHCTEYYQGDLKITYGNVDTFDTKTGRNGEIIYRESIDCGTINIIYKINGKYLSDTYLYIYDKLVIYSIDSQYISIYSSVNGLLFIVNIDLHTVKFSKNIEPKTDKSKKCLETKILDFVYKTDNKVNTGYIETLLKKEPFFSKI